MKVRPRNKKNFAKKSNQEAPLNEHNILPAPGILESYEEISPGAVKKILEIAKSEQGHRHHWENRKLKMAAYTTRMGQLFGFALAIIIIYTAMILAYNGKDLVAASLLFSGFAFLIAVIFACGKQGVATQPNKNNTKNRLRRK